MFPAEYRGFQKTTEKDNSYLFWIEYQNENYAVSVLSADENTYKVSASKEVKKGKDSNFQELMTVYSKLMAWEKMKEWIDRNVMRSEVS